MAIHMTTHARNDLCGRSKKKRESARNGVSGLLKNARGRIGEFLEQVYNRPEAAFSVTLSDTGRV